MSDLPPNLRDRVLQAAATRPAPTRTMTNRRRILTLIALGGALGSFAFMRGAPCIAGPRPASHLVVAGLAFAIVALSAAIFVLAPTRSTLGRRPAVRRLFAVAVPLALVIASLIANLSSPSTLHWPSTHIWDHIPCVVMMLVLGGTGLAALIRLERGFETIAPRATGASLGAVAGAWTALVMAIQCTQPDPIHVLVTHIVPVVLLVVLGMELGSRWLVVRWESERSVAP